MTKLTKEQTLHIVSFAIPYPANYGGVIDVYYKIKELSKRNVKVILHNFQYDREEAPELEKICSTVYYYHRKRFKNPLTGELPYIVSSRDNEDLLKNLMKDKHPILFEGLHTTYFIDHPDLKQRFKVVRNHNIEHHYYRNLEAAETNYFKKLFFRLEAQRLEKYEQKLKHAQLVAGISHSDTKYLIAKGYNAEWISAFHQNNKVNINPGKGDYILYHGNLGVAENNLAALYLVTKVFSLINLPVIIAGNSPSRELKRAVAELDHVTLKHKISTSEIMKLIDNAQINVMITFQATGIKLKLINALYRGRHALVNDEMVNNTGLETLCLKANNPAEIASVLFDNWGIPFEESGIVARKEILNKNFSNQKNTQKLIDLIQW
jgi:hypothetical protein